MTRNTHHPVQYRRLRRSGTAALVLGVAALVASGCSSSTKSGDSSGPGAGAAGPASAVSLSDLKPVSLTVGIPNVNVTHMDFYWPFEKGIFTKLGLNVTAVSQGSTESTNIAAGRLVLGSFGTTGMFPAVEAGRKMSIIASQQTGNSAGAIVVKSSSPYKSVQDLSGKKFGVVGASGAQYGGVELYSNYIVAHGGKALTVMVEANQGALTAAVESGQVDAATGSSFGAAIEAGVLRQIIGASDPLALQINNKDVATLSYFGLASKLSANKDAVIRFLAGIRIGLQQLNKASAAQITDALVTLPGFSSAQLSSSALAAEVQENVPFLPADGAYISADTWQKSLVDFKSYGLNTAGQPVNVESSQFSYSSVVDMSYWNAATPYVDAYDKQYGG